MLLLPLLDGVPVTSDDAPAGCLTPYGVGVFLANLDWCSSDRSSLLRRASPDIIIACDTIYLPELHEALGTVVREGITYGKERRKAEGRTEESMTNETSTQNTPMMSYPCAYFAQMKRNPETFTHYIDTFEKLGLQVNSLTSSVGEMTTRFAYDRDAIEFHQFTLP